MSLPCIARKDIFCRQVRTTVHSTSQHITSCVPSQVQKGSPAEQSCPFPLFPLTAARAHIVSQPFLSCIFVIVDHIPLQTHPCFTSGSVDALSPLLSSSSIIAYHRESRAPSSLDIIVVTVKHTLKHHAYTFCLLLLLTPSAHPIKHHAHTSSIALLRTAFTASTHSSTLSSASSLVALNAPLEPKFVLVTVKHPLRAQAHSSRRSTLEQHTRRCQVPS